MGGRAVAVLDALIGGARVGEAHLHEVKLAGHRGHLVAPLVGEAVELSLQRGAAEHRRVVAADDLGRGLKLAVQDAEAVD